jgi:hypothetical protein
MQYTGYGPHERRIGDIVPAIHVVGAVEPVVEQGFNVNADQIVQVYPRHPLTAAPQRCAESETHRGR